MSAQRLSLLNAALVTFAFAAPALFVNKESGLAGAAEAALFFGVPMAIALMVGVVSAFGAYRSARQRGTPMQWIGVAPLGIFCLGALILIALVAVRMR